MRSLLFTTLTPHSEPIACAPGRTEMPATFVKYGRLYKVVLRDKITVEDPYLVMVKATAFAIRTGEPYAAEPAARAVRDFLLKSAVVI